MSFTFNFKPITHDFTSKQLLSLNTKKKKKATGLDNINLHLLQDAAPAVVGPLTTIMNTSLQTGIIHWNEAKIIAIHKDEPPCNPSNNRLIFIISCCMKV